MSLASTEKISVRPLRVVRYPDSAREAFDGGEVRLVDALFVTIDSRTGDELIQASLDAQIPLRQLQAGAGLLESAPKGTSKIVPSGHGRSLRGGVPTRLVAFA